jgi:hypothetical protein
MRAMSNVSVAGRLSSSYARLLTLLPVLAIFAYSPLSVIQGETLEINTN